MSKNKESLIAWDPAWEDAVQQYKEEFRKAGMDWEGLGPHYPIGKETLYWKLQKDSLAGCSSSTYLYVREEEKRLLGMLNLRRGQTGESLARMGNIGFSIRPCEQGKGYAVRMLREAAPLSMMQGIIPWYMVCLADNETSRRVIARLGGRKQGETVWAAGEPAVEKYVVYDVF